MIFLNWLLSKKPDEQIASNKKQQLEQSLPMRERLQNAFLSLVGRDLNVKPTNNNDVYQQTSFLGSRKSSPSYDKTARQQYEPLQRRALIYELTTILADNPVLHSAVWKFVNGAVGAGFSITVSKAPNDYIKNRAKFVLDTLKRQTSLESIVPRIAMTAFSFGDSFAQPVTKKDDPCTICSIIEMPVDAIERLTDDCDQFIDDEKAYEQKDVNTQEHVDYFNVGQIIHIRNDYTSGHRYGSSRLFTARKAAKDVIEALAGILPRRQANQPFRVFDIKGFDGQPVSSKQFEAFKQKQSRKILISKGEYNPAWEDIFVTNVDVQVKSGDLNFGALGDIEMLIDACLSPTGVSRQLLGWGSTVNRDVLDEQREELYEAEKQFANQTIVAQFLQPLFDLALVLDGINPDELEYTIEFAQALTESQMIARIEQARQDYEAGGITLETYVRITSQYYGVKDLQRAVEELKANHPAPASLPAQKDAQEGSQPGSITSMPQFMHLYKKVSGE